MECDYMKKLIALVLALVCVLGLAGCSQAELEYTTETETYNSVVITTTETELRAEPTSRPVLDCKSLEATCADSFVDPSKVTVLGGEWAYTADPDKFVALATVRYTAKSDEFEIAEIVIVGTFDGKTELFHHLNEHSSYTRENVLRGFGAVDDQGFPLE